MHIKTKIPERILNKIDVYGALSVALKGKMTIIMQREVFP
jgi:hypothetical protein